MRYEIFMARYRAVILSKQVCTAPIYMVRIKVYVGMYQYELALLILNTYHAGTLTNIPSM